jgi:hypothetical protein
LSRKDKVGKLSLQIFWGDEPRRIAVNESAFPANNFWLKKKTIFYPLKKCRTPIKGILTIGKSFVLQGDSCKQFLHLHSPTKGITARNRRFANGSHDGWGGRNGK